MAIRGPFESGVNIAGINIQRTVWRQDKPFRAPLPYRHAKYVGRYTNNISGVTTFATDPGSLAFRYIQGTLGLSYDDPAYTRCFDSFVRKISDDNASMGVTIAESRSSLSMISNRSTQLVSALNSLRKRDFGSLMDSLNLSRSDSRGRRVWDRQAVKPSTPASQLLEYSFGWLPMVNDVRSACKVLSSTPHPVALTGGGTHSFVLSSGGNPGVRTDCNITLRKRMQGVVLIDNPNVNLANELGLVNPVQLAWQVIPYSFLVDTFFGVSQYLGRYSAMFGRSLDMGQLAQKVTVQSVANGRWYTGADLTESTTMREEGEQFVRTLISSPPRPTSFPTFRLPVHDLLGRAVTTTALLLQRMK